jgi:hypothetical protein
VQVLARIGSLTVSWANISAPVAMVLAIAALAHYTPKKWYERLQGLYVQAPFYAQAAALALLALGLQYVASTGAAPFIYSRF